MSKINVAIVFGGPSAEHDVSQVSAKNILAAIDTSKYEPYIFAVTKNKKWKWIGDLKQFAKASFENLVDVEQTGVPFYFKNEGNSIKAVAFDSEELITTIDVVFNICHGPFGEDGQLQGYFETLDLPYVGCDTKSSALCFDKALFKKALAARGFPQVAFGILNKEDTVPTFANISKQLGLPLFVKPANMGSAIGISKVTSKENYQKAIDEAFKHDDKILLEEAAIGQEIECAVFSDNDKIICSPLGEIVTEDFYNYEAKYLNAEAAKLLVPAEVDEEVSLKVRQLANQVFQLIGARHLLRVDFFYTQDGNLLINEANSLPGFTSISMYPRLMGEAGVSYKELIDRLLIAALNQT